MVELFESPVEFLLFGNDPRRENLIDVRVESPQLIGGHLLKLRSVITNFQCPTPRLGRVAANSVVKARTLTLIQMIALMAGPTALPS
ncbi:hypothetical protein [Bradyrhizobium ottawaense]